jgi:apolipoprotein N-acyltransferase
MAAALSGLLAALSLPAVVVTPWASYRLPDLGWLAWFAFVPLLFDLSRTASIVAAFRKGFAFGAVQFGMTLYWIVIAMHRYGEISLWASFLGLAVVIGITSLFPAAAAAGAVFLKRRGAPFGWAWILLTVSIEFLRHFFPFGGFPWSNLAYSQRSFLTLLQVLDLGGIHGILLLILLANVAIAEWMARPKGANTPQKGRFTRFASTVVFIFLMVAALTYGHFRLEAVRKSVASLPTIKIGIVQGNIPQEEKWIDERIDEIIDRHMELTERLQRKEPDLILWPEAAFPAVLPPEITKVAELRGLTVPLLMGVVRYDGVLPEDWPPKDETSFHLYNSAVLLEAEGVIDDRYDKVHLVPMGEYVPFQKYLPFLHQIAEDLSGFTRGSGFHLMEVGGAKFGVTICYEDLFPQISRSFTNQGAAFLVNLTNDGWYERSSAVFQHVDFSRYRAVENRRAMIRVTNTGVTAVFSPTGEVAATLPPFEEGTLSAEATLGGPFSFYARYGDWLAWACVAGAALVGVKALFVRRV